ncbi:Lecithin:cholesterol acyltransferase [Thioalkalivibrio sp. K90mix]|jgi:pimeloyl-ACP methyl ester carboxylesterase|uniref:esterase/lipase family protein n=1 Tax=Thioalkalivibrio sp. (strain K90mix) TaxID=396595 RepID=UPI000195AA20|nr:alpha/beta hydrolase [Thioalkalivibrio sp. K90mix]ADC71911.1 Lecithin:cholesterol acyltransferase [Thioalkalivibrio sp. K90mix]
MNRHPRRQRLSRKRLYAAAVLFGLPLLAFIAWVTWTEQHPEQERELRVEVQDRLHEWFPEVMELPDELRGFVPRSTVFDDSAPPEVVMLHGLDEPGDIWDTLASALDTAGINGWEFRYPNDQAIDHSADLLAEYWETLETDQPVILVGHSMGGLVIRDFVTRWRHPAGEDPGVEGPPIVGVILVATPNQGSDWARLRVWLEVREWLADIREQRFSLFAGLRDGTGAAKIDLRPGSEFLADLNQRPWPEDIPVRIIGGVVPEPTPAMEASLQSLSEQLGIEDLPERIEDWWEGTSEGLGDGVVPIDALSLEGHPEPLILEASHRGLLVPGPLTEYPPAIEPILQTLFDWRGESRSAPRITPQD